MRLRERGDNWRASGLRRREARQTAVADESARPSRAKKDRQRWCSGKVGREHELGPWVYGRFGFWRNLCQRCGKKFLRSDM